MAPGSMMLARMRLQLRGPAKRLCLHIDHIDKLLDLGRGKMRLINRHGQNRILRRKHADMDPCR